jgi:hypothetical protein
LGEPAIAVQRASSIRTAALAHLFQINVFIWRTREQDSAPRTGSRQSFQWVDWQKGKMEFCAVSDAEPVELKQLQQLMDSSA